MKSPLDLLGAVVAESTERCGRGLNADPFVWQVFARLLTATIKAHDREAAAGMVKVEDVARWLETKAHCGRQEGRWFAERIRKEFAATTAKEGT